jgi:uncharacterized protein YgbK (DUF1537 family)
MSDDRVLDAGVLKTFPAPDAALVEERLRGALARLGQKIVALDDDPTGVQTVHGVSVYTDWGVEALRAGFLEENSLFFVLTNSRGFTAAKTEAVHAEIARNLLAVSRETGKGFVVISRSDSTLRGHYPLETETLRRALEAGGHARFDGEIILPFFKEGGRFTIDNVHYVKEGETLVPAGQTEFARDRSFGYRNSHLGAWIEEKTGGAYRADETNYIPLSLLRAADYDAILARLLAVRDFNKIIVNAVDYVDVQVFCTAYAEAVKRGAVFLFRSAAAVTKVLGGISDRPPLSRAELLDRPSADAGAGPAPASDTRRAGGLVIIGSHVQKTTRQLEALRASACDVVFLEFDQHKVLSAEGLAPEVARVSAEMNRLVAEGRSAALFTRRDRLDLDTDDPDAQLRVSAEISDAVTETVARLTTRPSFIVAKGGVTSSDIGIRALGVKRAVVAGQIKPGIPVWRTGPESKFPGLPYVIFPGNVGETETLREIVELLT